MLAYGDYLVSAEWRQLVEVRFVGAQGDFSLAFISQGVEAFDQFGKDFTLHGVFSL